MIGKRTAGFVCFCQAELNPQDEMRFKDHIAYCRAFQENSPITKFFNGLKIDRLGLEELQIIKSEMELKLEELRNYIDIKKCTTVLYPTVKTLFSHWRQV